MKLVFYLNAAFFILLPLSTIAQTPIDEETSFLYFLKVNNKNFNDLSYPFGAVNTTCFWYYSSEFDKSNYANIKNDEFKKNNYSNQLSKTLRTKIDALSFKKDWEDKKVKQFMEKDKNSNWE